jgi:hypothetical protein
MDDILGITNTVWPMLLAFITLVIVLAKMHSSIQVLQDKVRSLFDLYNNIKDR